MNSSWSRISGSTVLNLSHTLTNDHLSLSQTKCDSSLYRSSSRSPSPSSFKLVKAANTARHKEDIVPTREKRGMDTGKVRPPSFADEMNTAVGKIDEEMDANSFKKRWSEEKELRIHAEIQLSQLKSKLSCIESLESEVIHLKSELKSARDDLRIERDRRKDLSEVRTSRETSQKQVFASFEDTISELKSELRVKSEEISHLRSTLRVSAEQRADLLKESELLRQTVAELKVFQRREMAELKSQLANECALRAATDRKLAEFYISSSSRPAEKDFSLRQQVEKLEGKLQSLEAQHREQAAISEGMKEDVQKLALARGHVRRKKEDAEDVSPPLTERNRRKPASKSPIRCRNGRPTLYD